MKLVIFADKNRGISFLGKRVSKDAAAAEHLLEITQDSNLYLSPNSGPLFSESFNIDHLIYTTTPEEVITKDAYVLLEGKQDYNWDVIEEIILINFNRVYPSDNRFMFPAGYQYIQKSTETIPGKSHSNITFDVFVKQEEA